MWEKIASLILATIIPASVLGSQSFVVNPAISPVDFTVEPLAIVLEPDLQEPEIRASAALVIETHSNEALYTKNVWETFPIASLTKMMTALVVKERLPLDQVITVSNVISKVGGSRMGLRVGEQITVENLLKGLLISSGNDAAFVLSEAVAGSHQEFVNLMNERKLSLGLDQTHFADPAGIDDRNISSAFEIAHLAKHVFKDPDIRSIMREKEAVVSSVDGEIVHHLSNTNRLLGTDIGDRIIAGKTGTTPVAGQCLVSFIGNEGSRTTITILLGSPDRYSEVKKLIEWVDASFSWE